MVAGVTALLASAGTAVAEGAQRTSRADTAPWLKSGTGLDRQIARSTFSAEPPESVDPSGLPPRSENVELVSKLTFTGGPGGSIAAGQIADVAVHKNTAYLMSWSEPADCTRGGFFTVDISDPAKPKELNFQPALPGSYHGEGAHVISVDTPTFTGDLLIVNNEPCPNAESDEEGEALAAGGFDLYDVTDPANPKPLSRGFGDFGPDQSYDEEGNLVDPGSLEGDDPFANSSHSSFLWEDDGRIYAVTVDNYELNDVDIFDVTDPRDPKPVGEFDFYSRAAEQGIDARGEEANGQLILHHDMVVKEIDGRKVLLSSYWDSGYMKWDIEDPANPLYLGDNDFDGNDPEYPAQSREGNAHQAEFSHDNRYFLAADEDFNPYRAGAFSITSGDAAGEYPSAEVGGATSPASLPDVTLNGPTVYVGYACDSSDPVPDRDSVGLRTLRTGEEAIAVVSRGPSGDPENTEEACFPGEKAENAIEAGYDAVLFVNHHPGEQEDPNIPYCGQGDFPAEPIVALCTTHRAFHLMFNSEPNTEVPYEPGTEPEIGDLGEDVQGSSLFDGWGYAHLYENNDGKIREVDTYAIPEAHDPRFAFGFGDLSIHEWATDPETNLGYSAYYAGGFRVVSFGEDGIQEVGSFIDEGGNNFWGVEQFTDAAGNRLVALADRDFGLYIMKYTGPGAVLAPAPETPGDGGGGDTGGGDQGGGGGPEVPGPQVVISTQAKRLSRTGVQRVRVRCPAEAGTACTGTLQLLSGTRRLGRASFTIEPGVTATVRVKWNKAARRLLRRKKALRVQAIADARNAAGARLSNTARITVRPASAKLKSNRPR